MDNVLARYATNPHEGMTHESYTPHEKTQYELAHEVAQRKYDGAYK